MQTKYTTLQVVLRENYNIDEPLFAEGRFVSLLGDHAANLVCLGLGMKCLVTAKIVFSGDTMDYDLLSLVPLTLLSMSYQCSSQEVTVRSQFKPTQTFQLCSSANQAAVWDNFTSIIRDVYQQESGDKWISTILQPVIEPKPNARFDQSQFEVHSDILFKESETGYIHTLYPRCTESSVSLPSRLPSQVRRNYTDTLSVYRSTDCLNVKFDNFVNENPLQLKKIGLNTSSNIIASSDICLNMDKEPKADNFCNIITNFFGHILPCCKHKE